MTTSINLASEGNYFIKVSALAPSHPALFDLLMATTLLQPSLDPRAGYGPFHVVRTFFELGIEAKHEGMFGAACGYDPYVAYVILRSCEYRYFDMRTFVAAVEAGCFSVRAALDHIRKFVPDFGTHDGAHRLEAAITTYEGNNANQEADSSAQT